MKRIDNATATENNRFTEGNPAQGIPATVVDAKWLNSVQDEIMKVIEAAGLEPSGAELTQLYDAIVSMIPTDLTPPDAATAVKGILKLATPCEIQSGTNDTKAVT
ncbi:phage tail protein, partial [Pseudodesulfovibrio sp. JC047]|nr:phage tail protein [Pseudodesulfovibrio sp. JC047]